MCSKIKTIAKVKSGELSLCTNCNHYHLMFNNIFFEFSRKELKQFRDYVFNINLEYWESNYPCPVIKKNIPIPSLQKNLILIFNRKEIEELKKLLSFKSYHKFQEIELDDIDYTLILN
ncbi:DUF6686 family protein [Pseudotenacibaculum haliotis]|uniref:DUF6686 family protein n=1 Tax=Pseudotenacibaculum haliotis TaxID=1862138 RepID=A0ABW5LVM4_9FLAO